MIMGHHENYSMNNYIILKYVYNLVHNLKFLVIALMFFVISIIYSCTEIKENEWLKMDKAEQINFLVGYTQGTETGFDISEYYKNSITEKFLNINNIQKREVIETANLLYQKEENQVIDWKSILIVSFSLNQGEDERIIEYQLEVGRQLIGNQLKVKAGEYWLKLPNKYKLKYLNGLLEGIKTGIYIMENNITDLKHQYEGIFNTGSNIDGIVDKVSTIYRNTKNQEISYRYVFPAAYLMYLGNEVTVIDTFAINGIR